MLIIITQFIGEAEIEDEQETIIYKVQIGDFFL